MSSHQGVLREVTYNDSGFPQQYLKLSNVLQIYAGNNKEVIGVLSDPATRLPVPALYVFDPLQGEAKLVAEVRKGNLIFDAALDNEWVSWVEKNDKAWSIFIKPLNKLDQSPRLIAKGTYFVEAGTDYPSISLSKGKLVFNSSNKEDNRVSSVLTVADLAKKARSSTTVSKDYGVQIYYGPPDIYGDQIVWHKGEWTKAMRGEVLLHNLSSHATTRLPTTDEAITPVIWDHYVVWVAYSGQLPEKKYIEQYDLNSNMTKRISRESSYSHMENWGPMVGDGLITWFSNEPNIKPSILSLTTGDRIDIDLQDRVLYLSGKWLYWAEQASGVGIIWTSEIISEVEGRKALESNNPAQVVNAYLAARKVGNWGMVDRLISKQEGLVDRSQYLTSLKEEKVLEYDVSGDYMIRGEEAEVRVRLLRVMDSNSREIVQSSVVYHLIKENGKWRIPQLAAQ